MLAAEYRQGASTMRTRLRVKEVAQAQGMSMTKLHHRSEVAYGTIRKIFRDPYTEITITTLSRLAQALGVMTPELIEDVADDEAMTDLPPAGN